MKAIFEEYGLTIVEFIGGVAIVGAITLLLVLLRDFGAAIISSLIGG